MFKITKNVNKQKAREILKEVEGDLRFFCCNGQIFSSLEDLSKGLSKMEKEHFSYHSSKERSDFANWIEDVLGDKKLAEELRNACESKTKTSQAIKKRLKELKKAAK